MEPQKVFLEDFEQELTMEQASVGQRIANYVIDFIMFYIGCLFAGIGLGLFFPEIFRKGEYGNESPRQLLLLCVCIVVWVLYYTICEAANGGKSVGKMVTGTRTVREDGSSITWKDALIRSLIRLVPFEPLSAFNGHPWHDSWSGTLVVKKTKIYS